MIALAAVLLLTSVQQGPLPPYKRIETVPIFQEAYGPAVVLDGSTIFVANNDSCYAYDLRTSKRIWEYKTKGEEYVRNICLAGGKLFAVTVGEQDTGRLIAFDAKTGAGLWSLPRTSDESAVFATSNTVFADMKPRSISAIDIKTRATKWTFDFPKPEQDISGIDALGLHGNFLLVNSSTTTFCLDAATGRKHWTESPTYMFGDTYLVQDGIALVPSGEGAVAREISTGKELWRKANDSYSDGGVVFQGLFVMLDGGAVKGVAPKTGEVKWSVPVGSPEWAGGAQFVSVVGDTLYVRGMDKSVILDKVGKVTWQGKDDEGLPHPVWSDGKTIVCFDGDRLLRYEHGVEDPLPAGEARTKLAEDMVARFNELDDADKRRLVALGDDAFPPLLKEYLATCAKYDAADHESEDTYPLYSRYHDLGELLKLVTTTHRAADIMKAIEAPGSHPTAKPLLLSLLAQKGNPDDVTPYFLRELENAKTPGFEMYESISYVARNYIVRSRDPRAVAFMLKALRDPNADEVMRYEAYTHLAGTGGEEGVKAVLEQRRAWKPLRTIAERAAADFNGQNPSTRVVNESKAADGATWGLLQIGILGSRSDLWLAKKQADVWSDFVFLGVTTDGISNWVEPKVSEPTVSGKTGAELVKADWLPLLLADESIRKDTDGDGLTDLVEKRLGTNPSEKDTDGDGEGDETDPWPNAPKRELSEAEKVLAAVFEARYHRFGYEGAAIFSAPKGMKPFEMVGWGGPVAWTDQEGWAHPLQWYYEQGIAFIGFNEHSRQESMPWEDRVIKWSSDRTEATVEISTYYGGLNGSGYRVVVRKFGDEWLPIEVVMEYVS